MAKSKFACINAILPRVVVDLGLDRRMQELALFSLWPSLLEPIYASRSAPLYIDSNGILVVAAENGSTAQELSFLKTKLLAKLQPVAQGLGLSIKGMRFDLKRFSQSVSNEMSTRAFQNEAETKILPSEEELAAFVLNEAELGEIVALKEKLQTNQLSERIVYLVEKKLRIKKWCLKNDIPICAECYEPLPQSSRQRNIMLCFFCKKAGIAIE